MKQYFRLMLGKGSEFAKNCASGNFVGADFGINQDLTRDLPEEWRQFNQKFIPVFLKNRPDKSKIAAGLACGFLWTVAKGMKKGDVVLCPNGEGGYLVGEVISEYSYHPGDVLPHRRAVRWHSRTILRTEMSQSLKNSSGSIGTVCELTKFANEIEGLIGNSSFPKIVATDDSIQDPSVFALEEHLESFLVANWPQTELGKQYDIFEDGELSGQQYQTDTGPIDILAISKDKSELLVVELKKGRASDNVVGQIQRYMGYVMDELAENGQKVRGIIIALDDDVRIKRALSVTQNIELYRYQVNFKLFKSR